MAKTNLVDGVHNYLAPEEYITPKEPAVQEHIKWFQGLKLGFMMHWSPGSQLGVYESWPLSDGDSNWSRKGIDWTDGETFKEQYINANKTFNPVKFRPDRFAALAKECGFQYLLFTSKHHDGFCMYDTKTTDYKITDPSCPFHTHPHSDIVGALYEAFRKEGLAISTYFSKPDWHSNYYWRKEFGLAPTRNVNYDITLYSELWEKYVAFVHEQIRELANNYGKIDVLWLDGGWVNKENLHQDIRLEEIVAEIRNTTQPHLIVCDRTVGGEFENIITPEKTIPEEALMVPWETCITIGDKFSFHYTDNYKSGIELVHLLLEVVSKGGNLALNIPPQPDGELPKPAVHSIKELGGWLKTFGDGIYQTIIQAPYLKDNLFYTRKENHIYAFYRYDITPFLPEVITLTIEAPILSIQSMRTKEEVPFIQKGNEVLLITKGLSLTEACYAEGFVASLPYSL